MNSVEIRKGKGIERLVGTPKVEEVRQIEVIENDFCTLNNQYAQILDEGSVGELWCKTISDILTPTQINVFLQHTTLYENNQHYSGITGYFISQLIQNSYNDGYNNFSLNTSELQDISFLGHRIEGTPKKTIELTVIGQTGRGSGWGAKYAAINLIGNTGHTCGKNSENSVFYITGDTERECGKFSINSTFHISGNTGHDTGGGSERSTFNIAGNTGNLCGQNSICSKYTIGGYSGRFFGDHTKKSTYKTPNKETYIL